MFKCTILQWWLNGVSFNIFLLHVRNYYHGNLQYIWQKPIPTWLVYNALMYKEGKTSTNYSYHNPSVTTWNPSLQTSSLPWIINVNCIGICKVLLKQQHLGCKSSFNKNFQFFFFDKEASTVPSPTLTTPSLIFLITL